MGDTSYIHCPHCGKDINDPVAAATPVTPLEILIPVPEWQGNYNLPQPHNVGDHK